MGFNIHKTVWDMTPELDITASELSVLSALAMFMNDVSHDCHPSIPRIAQQTKLGSTTIKAKLKSLQEKGLITETRRFNRSNLYAFTFLTGTASANGTPARPQVRRSPKEKEEIDALTDDFVGLCRNPANRKRDWNTFNKLIRERDVGLCRDVFFAVQSKIQQGEHDNARNIGAILSNKLKDVPTKVINSPGEAVRPMGQYPTHPGSNTDPMTGQPVTAQWDGIRP